ncbi:cysteine desulfurase [Candidatus Giovannonibacteria bacterium]|nr:cysteine desulfurase [Candidatus Giovannonibacteria bacterium]
MKRIYLDYAAATPINPEAKKAMEEFYDGTFGNASGLYQEGREAKKALDASRASIARIINAKPNEIIFTSGGTESNNLAIFGAFGRTKNSGHIITSAFEHRSVLEPIKELGRQGVDVTYLKVSPDGFVNPEDVKKELRPDTALVSIMFVNNEIGTIQPIREISKIIKEHQTLFHTDACQAAAYLDFNIDSLGVDMASFSGAKIYGPKGVGFLYKRKGVRLASQILGGPQEMGYRSGTEALSQIVGMARALEIAANKREKEALRLEELRNFFAEEVVRKIPDAQINGAMQNRIPSNLSVSFPGTRSEQLILALDEKGIAVSSGSACDSKLEDLPHVIAALGRSPEIARSVIRFSFGVNTEKSDIDYLLEALRAILLASK